MATRKETISGTIRTTGTLSGSLSAPHTSFEKDYEKLIHKPSINEVELIGNKNLEDLNVNELSPLDIIDIWNNVWGDDD